MEVKSNTIFTSAVTIANYITNEIAQTRCYYKQTKLTDFSHKNNLKNSCI